MLGPPPPSPCSFLFTFQWPPPHPPPLPTSTNVLFEWTLEAYPATNVRKKFITTNLWQIFILSHPHPPPALPLKWEGEQKPCTIKLFSYLVRNNMEPYYPCTWLSFINQKNEKNKKLKFDDNDNCMYILFLRYCFSKQLICILHTYSLNKQTTEIAST